MGCTSNNCPGLIYTSRVETDGFGTDSDFDKTQRARLDRLTQQYREWSERYSQRETMDVDEYIQGLDEMASMSSELDAIMKQTGPMDAFGRARSMTTAGALVYYDAESGLLNNIASAQTQYLRVGINVAPDNPVVAQNRWDSILTAMALMKSGGIGGPRAAIGASRIARMRNMVAAWRGRTKSSTKPATTDGVAVSAQAGSIRNVNPGYPDAPGRTQNCVNCSQATDATLGGNPASALPSRGPVGINALESQYGGRFSNAMSPSAIQEQMLSAGNGARGIVFGARGPGEVGHVFNVVNQNGVVRFLDGQVGGSANLNGYTNFHLLRTNKP